MLQESFLIKDADTNALWEGHKNMNKLMALRTPVTMNQFNCVIQTFLKHT